MIRCSNCGTVSEPGGKFCRECGARLAAGCPTCGTPNPADAKFCAECGTALTPAAAAVPAIGGDAATPVAERRVVSVLFADLVGFTPFAEERDPEETRAVLTRYFATARDVIGRYGGTVEKFIGDAVMAVWGAPVATENDAERAVRAALELTEAIRALDAGLEARAAVLTGEAAVTIGAPDQGMVAGDLVNTASRLQSAAPPGAVLVGESTHRSAVSAIAFEEAGEQVLRGKVAPVRAWRALRVVAEVGGRNRSESLEAPFVGRDEELRQLKDRFHGTSRERRAGLVSVIGAAGVGKSRLAWEFLKYVDGLLEVVYWHDGRSPAYGERITFWALGEMVRARAGLLESDEPATTREKVAATVREHVSDADERRWIERALLVLLGVESGMSPQELFPAWRTFFERLAASAPVIMVFEDLHWADSGTIEFVDHLLEWSRNAPIFVLTLARPELLERHPGWGAAKRTFTSLLLEPLPEPAMRQLLAGLAPNLPDAAVREILRRADGIPLYAVETIRMLVAEGRLEPAGDAYAPVGELTNLAVPETLTALIAARLDALGPADRAVLQDAAVLGQSFTPAALAAISGVSEGALEARLRALVRRELLRIEADPRSPERGQYAFVQSLVREVAYNMLARDDRRSRHVAAARYFESLGSDELASALAGHYLAAHANATLPEEADALAAQARLALRAAAARARALGAHAQAAEFLNQALSVTHEPEEQAALLESAVEAALGLRDTDTAQRHATRAVELRRTLGAAGPLAHAVALLGSARIEAYDTSAAIAVLEPARRELSDAGPAAAEMTAQLARALFLRGNNSEALPLIDEVLVVAERNRLFPLLADTLVSKGSAFLDLGRGVEGTAVLEAGQRLAEREGLVSTALRAALNGSFFLGTRDPRAAFELGSAGIEYAERMGLPFHLFDILANVGMAALRLGRWSWASERCESALASERLPPTEHAFLLEVTALIDALRGRPQAAERLTELELLLADADDLQLRAVVPNVRAYLRWSAGDDRGAADEWLSSGVGPTMLNGRGVPGLVARSLLWARDATGAQAALAMMSDRTGDAEIAQRTAIEAGLAALTGDRAAALARYRDARALARDLELTFDEALIGLDMALLLGASDPAVQEPVASARETLVELDAQPFLARLDAVLERTEVAVEPAADGAPGPAPATMSARG
jgi:class 3 adenylate cyclase/tetratricopeptide (TPR) repeat protein